MTNKLVVKAHEGNNNLLLDATNASRQTKLINSKLSSSSTSSSKNSTSSSCSSSYSCKSDSNSDSAILSTASKTTFTQESELESKLTSTTTIEATTNDCDVTVSFASESLETSSTRDDVYDEADDIVTSSPTGSSSSSFIGNDEKPSSSSSSSSPVSYENGNEDDNEDENENENNLKNKEEIYLAPKSSASSCSQSKQEETTNEDEKLNCKQIDTHASCRQTTNNSTLYGKRQHHYHQNKSSSSYLNNGRDNNNFILNRNVRQQYYPATVAYSPGTTIYARPLDSLPSSYHHQHQQPVAYYNTTLSGQPQQQQQPQAPLALHQQAFQQQAVSGANQARISPVGYHQHHQHHHNQQQQHNFYLSDGLQHPTTLTPYQHQANIATFADARLLEAPFIKSQYHHVANYAPIEMENQAPAIVYYIPTALASQPTGTFKQTAQLHSLRPTMSCQNYEQNQATSLEVGGQKREPSVAQGSCQEGEEKNDGSGLEVFEAEGGEILSSSESAPHVLEEELEDEKKRNNSAPMENEALRENSNSYQDCHHNHHNHNHNHLTLAELEEAERQQGKRERQLEAGSIKTEAHLNKIQQLVTGLAGTTTAPAPEPATNSTYNKTTANNGNEESTNDRYEDEKSTQLLSGYQAIQATNFSQQILTPYSILPVYATLTASPQQHSQPLQELSQHTNLNHAPVYALTPSNYNANLKQQQYNYLPNNRGQLMPATYQCLTSNIQLISRQKQQQQQQQYNQQTNHHFDSSHLNNKQQEQQGTYHRSQLTVLPTTKIDNDTLARGARLNWPAQLQEQLIPVVPPFNNSSIDAKQLTSAEVLQASACAAQYYHEQQHFQQAINPFLYGLVYQSNQLNNARSTQAQPQNPILHAQQHFPIYYVAAGAAAAPAAAAPLAATGEPLAEFRSHQYNYTGNYLTTESLLPPQAYHPHAHAHHTHHLHNQQHLLCNNQFCHQHCDSVHLMTPSIHMPSMNGHHSHPHRHGHFQQPTTSGQHLAFQDNNPTSGLIRSDTNLEQQQQQSFDFLQDNGAAHRYNNNNNNNNNNNLLASIPIVAEPTKTRQAYGMDKVWLDEFEQLFSQFATMTNIIWTLAEVESNPIIRECKSIVCYKGHYVIDKSLIEDGNEDYTTGDVVGHLEAESNSNEAYKEGSENEDNNQNDEVDEDEKTIDAECSVETKCCDSSLEFQETSARGGDEEKVDHGQGGVIVDSSSAESMDKTDQDSGVAIDTSSSSSSSSTSSSSFSFSLSGEAPTTTSDHTLDNNKISQLESPKTLLGTRSDHEENVENKEAFHNNHDDHDNGDGDVFEEEEEATCTSKQNILTVNDTSNQIRRHPTKFRMFIDSAKVRFCCDNCGHGWTSMKGRVVFWYELFEIISSSSSNDEEPSNNNKTNDDDCNSRDCQNQNDDNNTNDNYDNNNNGEIGELIGYCAYKLFGQRCDICKIENRFERPMWYPEEVSKVLNNLYNKIGQIYFGFKMPVIDKQRRAGKPKTSHNSSLCQACHDGVCTDRK